MQAMPADVQDVFGAALLDVEYGDVPDGARPYGEGLPREILKIAEDHDGDTYRCAYDAPRHGRADPGRPASGREAPGGDHRRARRGFRVAPRGGRGAAAGRLRSGHGGDMISRPVSPTDSADRLTQEAPMTAATTSPSAYSTPFSGPDADLAAIHEVLTHYAEGLRTGDVARLTEAFHPQSLMCGYLGATPMVTPIQGLYDFVAAHDAPVKSGEPNATRPTAIRVADSANTATAEVREEAYMGHDFVTSFQLMKLDGRWWITAKLFDGTPRG
jgi:hypothetical protein